MNNPLDTSAFRHYLIFTSLGRTDLYEICEPIGFDSANFVLKQESKRYARSIEYGAIDKLTFVDAYGIQTEEPRIINPQGDQSYFLDYGLKWLLSIYKEYGFEAKVEYILEKGGVQFSGGMLDFTEKDITDGYTYLSCKLIQKNKVANLKRRLDDKFNAFSDKNVNQETITPAPTINVLYKALPLFQQSTWKYGLVDPTEKLIGNSSFNYSNQTLTYGIRNSLSYIQGVSNADDFRYVYAVNELTDITVELTNIDVSVLPSIFDGNFKLIWRVGAVIEDTDQNILQSGIEEGMAFNDSFTFNIPLMRRGDYLWIYFRGEGGGGLVRFASMDVKISLTSTAVDSVVKMVRWVDLINQASKFSSAIPIDAPLFESGGKHYNNACFNRRMISQNTDFFYSTPKNVFESVEEINCDYEPDEESIFIGHQRDFYTNDEIGVFNIIPSEDFTIEENDRCQINKLKYAYKTFEQDRTSLGTSQVIHSDAEFTFLNDNVENVKEVKNEFVRDPLTIQKIVELEIQQPTTSTDEDDKVMISNIIALAPSSFNQFGIRLTMRIVDGVLEILNRQSTDDADTTVINWNTLGFDIGSSFYITEGENIGTYTVLGITNTVLRLTPVVGIPTFDGNAFIRIKYYYTNVFWTTRTNEGIVATQNIETTRFGNLLYSIKRNLLEFEEYMASCLLYSRKDIPNAYFKCNGIAGTQLSGEEMLVENDTITFDSLPNPLTTAKIYNLVCVAEFNDVLDYLEAYKVSRGFIRAYDSFGRVIKGYVQDLDHTWQTNELKLTIEERFETEYLVLVYADGVLTVNDAQYELGGVSNWWRFDNDYLKLYDAQNRPLSNFYRYNFVELNGIVYETKADLLFALNNL